MSFRCCMTHFFLFLPSSLDLFIIFQCLNLSQFTFLFTYWRTLWLFLSFGNYEETCYKHLHAGVCMDIHFNSFGSLQRKCDISMYNFVRNVKLSSKVAVSFCIPTLLYTLTIILWCQCFWFLAILKGVEWSLVVVLICISLVTYNVEHLFIFLFAICVSFFKVSKSLANF